MPRAGGGASPRAFDWLGQRSPANWPITVGCRIHVGTARSTWAPPTGSRSGWGMEKSAAGHASLARFLVSEAGASGGSLACCARCSSTTHLGATHYLNPEGARASAWCHHDNAGAADPDPELRLRGGTGAARRPADLSRSERVAVVRHRRARARSRSVPRYFWSTRFLPRVPGPLSAAPPGPAARVPARAHGRGRLRRHRRAPVLDRPVLVAPRPADVLAYSRPSPGAPAPAGRLTRSPPYPHASTGDRLTRPSTHLDASRGPQEWNNAIAPR